jgi:hypothetical protein
MHPWQQILFPPHKIGTILGQPNLGPGTYQHRKRRNCKTATTKTRKSISQ